MKNTEDPDCRPETIFGRPSYMCERIVNGETQKFGISFGTNMFYCGEYQNNHLNGPGVGFHLGRGDDQISCGLLVDDMHIGGTSRYDFYKNTIELGEITVSQKLKRFWIVRFSL